MGGARLTDFQPWWEWGHWVYRAVVTQANAGGGAVVVDITPAAGDTMIVLHAHMVNSGTNTAIIDQNDEDDNLIAQYINVGSGAGTAATVPRTYTTMTTSIIHTSQHPAHLMIRGDNHLVLRQSGAGAQNDTMTVNWLIALSSAALPTISKARSTNDGDVTIGTPTVNKVV